MASNTNRVDVEWEHTEVIPFFRSVFENHRRGYPAGHDWVREIRHAETQINTIRDWDDSEMTIERLRYVLTGSGRISVTDTSGIREATNDVGLCIIIFVRHALTHGPYPLASLGDRSNQRVQGEIQRIAHHNGNLPPIRFDRGNRRQSTTGGPSSSMGPSIARGGGYAGRGVRHTPTSGFAPNALSTRPNSNSRLQLNRDQLGYPTEHQHNQAFLLGFSAQTPPNLYSDATQQMGAGHQGFDPQGGGFYGPQHPLPQAGGFVNTGQLSMYGAPSYGQGLQGGVYAGPSQGPYMGAGPYGGMQYPPMAGPFSMPAQPQQPSAEQQEVRDEEEDDNGSTPRARPRQPSQGGPSGFDGTREQRGDPGSAFSMSLRADAPDFVPGRSWSRAGPDNADGDA